ncbi:MAG: helix-turn-helix domain-containing protein [Chloroflexi bacterium]|nr:helix-turn-helix domain-containing protein [Chloroflexota bacterium]
MADSTYRVVPAVDKAARLLAELSSGDALGISELARRITASKGTVRDILLTLAQHGLVNRDANGQFQRGDASDIASLAAPYLRELERTFGETALFGMVAGGRLEVVARVEPAHDLHVTARVGYRIPLDAGAHGKVIIGELPIGYDDGSYLAGVRAAAGPVIDKRGRRIGVIMVVGFKERVDLKTLKRMGTSCARAASALSARLDTRASMGAA